MAGKYLKSLVTGVVLPYNEPALKCADLRLMEPAECEEYEASLKPASAPKPVAKKKAKKKAKVKAKAKDTSDDIDKVVAALEVD